MECVQRLRDTQKWAASECREKAEEMLEIGKNYPERGNEQLMIEAYEVGCSFFNASDA